jgi:hypothetical protein
MKISSELASKLINSVPQLEKKFNIIISFIHPIGTFLRKNSDFVIFQEGCLNNETKTVDYGDTFIVEYCHELKGIFVRYKTDFNIQTEKPTNFLINFHNWIKTGEIKL